MTARTLFFSFLAALSAVRAITVYGHAGQTHISTGTSTTKPRPTKAAYDPLVLDPPPLPDPRPATQFGIHLAADAGNMPGLSIAQSGAFYGFSIEMSVVTQVIGLNGSYIHPPFLNLMSLVVERAGRVHVRVGGNTQETARMVMELADGKAIEKQKVDTNNPTQTPALLYTPEILYLLSNVSSLLNLKWYLGIPLNETSNIRLEIAEYGERILGDSLIGLQVGNEPDLYARHKHRPESYSPFDYFGEFAQILETMKTQGIQRTDLLIGPSLATGDWTPEMVWDTGFIPAFHDALTALTVEHYPNDNCAAIYEGFGEPKNPQEEFPLFLDHSLGVNLVAPYLNSTRIAQEVGKPFIMFETNSASCGGLPGVSASFGAALWALDYGLEMAASNFSHALLHVGGQNVYYNPFTAVPTNESHFNEWTIGPIFYSVLAVAESFGRSNNSRIIDLWQNSGSLHTPGYAIYENGRLARVALFNFMTDPSGANDYTVSIAVGGGTSGQPPAAPPQVRVKRLTSPSVSEKFNITWGNQTFGGQSQSDGRLKGDLHLETVQCDQAANACLVKVPAPGFALVFMSDEAVSGSQPESTVTFSTSVITKLKNTATIDEAVLATSNGNRGMENKLGSTSFGSATGAGAHTAGAYPGLVALVALVAGAGLMRHGLLRQI